MATQLPVLSEFERDAILEIFNMGVGAAGVTLSEMVGGEVVLTLPSLELVSRDDLAGRSIRPLSAVEQTFSSPFGAGRAILTFPEERSLNLVSALMGEETGLTQLTAMQEEALTEVGNILLNSCLARLGDMMSQEIELSVPRFQRAAALGELLGSDQGDVLMLSVEFNLHDRAVEGRLLFVIEVDRLKPFIGVVQTMMLGAG